MSASDYAQNGTCLDPAHNSQYNEYIDSLEARIVTLEVGLQTGVETYDPDYYSELGVVAGGATVAAGSTFPAIAGKLILQPGATFTWAKITNTAAEIGDTVEVFYEGRRVATPNNPASRILSAAGPGATGTNVLNAGEIEVAMNSSNTDGTFVHWKITRKGS